MGPPLIFSGGLGSITKRLWHEPEADQFAAIARAMGVPAANILIENASTNTGENILFTRKLLDRKSSISRHSSSSRSRIWSGGASRPSGSCGRKRR